MMISHCKLLPSSIRFTDTVKTWKPTQHKQIIIEIIEIIIASSTEKSSKRQTAQNYKTKKLQYSYCNRSRIKGSSMMKINCI